MKKLALTLVAAVALGTVAAQAPAAPAPVEATGWPCPGC